MADVGALAPESDAAAREGSGRRPTTGAWAGGAVLLAGLAVVAVSVATAKGVDLHVLHLIQGDGTSVHVVAGDYPGVWRDPAFNPFVENRLRLLTPLATLIYLVSVAGIGAPLVGAIRGASEWPRAVRFLAGFLPGYLMMLAPLQLLFAVVSPLTAAWIALVATPVVAVLVCRRSLAEAAGALRRDAGDGRRAWLTAVGVVGLIVLLCGIHRLQSGRYFMLPDSMRFFVGGADAQFQGAFGGHLAQWAQQSDEWVFSAPLIFNAHAASDQQFAYWSTQFVSMASFIALIFGLVWTFAWKRRTLAGALAVGMILVSTPAIYPWENVPIVGGSNPAFLLAHPGRLISIVAPWIALLLLRRWSGRQTVAILLATAGLAFITVDGVAFVGLAVGCAGIWRLVRGRWSLRGQVPGSRRAGAAAIHVLALAVLAAPLYVYYAIHETTQPDGLAWVLLGALALAVVGLAGLASISAPAAPNGIPGGRGVSWRATVGLSLASIATLICGFFFSNNLVGDFAGGSVRRAIGSILPGFQGRLLDREIPFELSFPSFTGDECSISGHCVSFGYFLGTYGFTLALALAGWVALGRLSDDEQVNRRRAAWLVTVASLGLAFVIVDFTGADSSTAWILTRFIEVPYYAILAFAAIVLVSSRSRVTVVAGTAVLAVWTLVPFFHSHIPEQWVKNVEYLIGTLH
jgi:hypothetical protein